MTERHEAAEPQEPSVLRELLEKLEAVTEKAAPTNPKLRQSWSARCPSHEDRNPSLEVTLWNSGSIGVRCWAGCETVDVLSALDLTASQLKAKHTGRPRMVTAYAYHDERGEVLYRVARFEPKTFRMQRPDGKGGWFSGIGDVRRVLFRLPKVLAAVAKGIEIYVCEGEKDVGRLESYGLVATCNPNGAGKWRPEYSEALRGARVVLLPDNDEPGLSHMRTVALALAGIAVSVKLVVLSDLPEKGDICDWLDLGHTSDELWCLVEDAAEFVPPAAVVGSHDDVDRADYEEKEDGLFRLSHRGPRRIANFVARITRVLIEDDGTEQSSTFELTARCNGKTSIFTLTPSEFTEMNWPVLKLGPRAAIMPGVFPNNVRYAIQLFSDYQVETVYTHTGWRELEPGVWVFLHAGGAICATGQFANISVRVGRALELFTLPVVPVDTEAVCAVACSLHLLLIAPHKVMVPLLGAVWRAPLGPVDLSLQLTGTTGAGKTEIAARLQQHFGLGFDSRRLVASWSSTPNALEGLLFQTKDVLVVIDDFAPRGSENSVRQMHQNADRIFRAQGNSSGRARMRSDTSLRPPKPPRGLVLSTGEDLATGRSATARTLVIDLDLGAVVWEEMTRAQADGAAGSFAKTMSGYIQYLAQHHSEIADSRSQAIEELRELSVARSQHPRTPEIIANLLLGWRWFLRYARSIGALSTEESTGLESVIWDSLLEVSEAQELFQAQEAQGQLFLTLISSALDSGVAHLATFDGGRPEGWERLGWQCQEMSNGDSVRALGPRIGFIKDGDIFLLPDPALKAAQDMARGSQNNIVLSSRMLHKSLYEEGLLKSTERRGNRHYFAVRRQIGTARIPVLHIRADSLGRAERPRDGEDM